MSPLEKNIARAIEAARAFARALEELPPLPRRGARRCRAHVEARRAWRRAAARQRSNTR